MNLVQNEEMTTPDQPTPRNEPAATPDQAVSGPIGEPGDEPADTPDQTVLGPGNEPAATPDQTPAAPTHRGVWARIGDVLLTIAAIGGAISIVATILALIFKISIMMFATGSMSPTIPAGSIALVREIPAAEARVGDVVTIDRPDELPITHRITKIADSDTDGNRVITMRGDANATEDPAPYDVGSVRRVFFSMPGVAQSIVFISNPVVMGTITVLAAGLVTWAFWPKRGRHRLH